MNRKTLSFCLWGLLRLVHTNSCTSLTNGIVFYTTIVKWRNCSVGLTWISSVTSRDLNESMLLASTPGHGTEAISFWGLQGPGSSELPQAARVPELSAEGRDNSLLLPGACSSELLLMHEGSSIRGNALELERYQKKHVQRIFWSPKSLLSERLSMKTCLLLNEDI